MPLTIENIKTLTEWLGVEGAAAGLSKSNISISELRDLLATQGFKAPKNIKKIELITELLFGSVKRVEKPLDDLLKMEFDELLRYFRVVRPSRKELLALLSELDFHPGSEDQKSLYKYAARQIVETGMFKRVAKKTSF